MGTLRTVIAAVLLVGVVGGAAALFAWQRGAPAGAGVHDLEILGPDGSLYHGRLEVASATPLTLLQAASDAEGFRLVVESYPGMGAYVRTIGAYEASGASGWVYEVRSGEAAWVKGGVSAEYHALTQGDSVRWRWTADGA